MNEDENYSVSISWNVEDVLSFDDSLTVEENQ